MSEEQARHEWELMMQVAGARGTLEALEVMLSTATAIVRERLSELDDERGDA